MLGVYVNDYSALLDACVLAPMPSCDSLLHLAEAGFFTPRWSDHILAEVRMFLEKRGKTPGQIDHRIQQMAAAFEDACIYGYEDLISSMATPDPGDQHVLAAAVKARVNVIVTQNLKDFPNDCLARYDIAVQPLDHFMTDQYHLDPDLFINTLKKQSELRKIEFSRLISNLSKDAPTLGKLISA